MKLISVINERPVIRKILEHLNLWNDPRKQRPPPRAGPQLPRQEPHQKHTQHELFDDGWPGFDEPYMTYD